MESASLDYSSGDSDHEVERCTRSHRLSSPIDPYLLDADEESIVVLKSASEPSSRGLSLSFLANKFADLFPDVRDLTLEDVFNRHIKPTLQEKPFSASISFSGDSCLSIFVCGAGALTLDQLLFAVRHHLHSNDLDEQRVLILTDLFSLSTASSDGLRDLPSLVEECDDVLVCPRPLPSAEAAIESMDPISVHTCSSLVLAAQLGVPVSIVPCDAATPSSLVGHIQRFGANKIHDICDKKAFAVLVRQHAREMAMLWSDADLSVDDLAEQAWRVLWRSLITFFETLWQSRAPCIEQLSALEECVLIQTIGEMLLSVEEVSSAREHFEQCLALYERQQLGSWSDLILFTISLTNVHILYDGDYVSAVERLELLFQKTVTLSTVSDAVLMLLMHQLGKCFLHLGRSGETVSLYLAFLKKLHYPVALLVPPGEDVEAFGVPQSASADEADAVDQTSAGQVKPSLAVEGIWDHELDSFPVTPLSSRSHSRKLGRMFSLDEIPPAGAEPSLESSGVFEQVGAHSYESVCDALYQIAKTWVQTGSAPSGRVHMVLRHALVIFQHFHAADTDPMQLHRDRLYVRLRVSLAGVLQRAHRLDDAAAIYADLLEHFLAIVDDTTHLEIVTMEYHCAHICDLKGDTSAALAAYQRAVIRAEGFDLARHKLVLMIRSRMVQLYSKQLDDMDRMDEAFAATFAMCIDVYVSLIEHKKAGPDDYNAQVQQLLGGLVHVADKHVCAGACLSGLEDVCMGMCEYMLRAQPDKAKDALGYVYRLAVWYEQAGDCEKAVDLYQVFVSRMERAVAPDEQLCEVCMRIAGLCDTALGDADTAAMYYDKCVELRTQIHQTEQHAEVARALYRQVCLYSRHDRSAECVAGSERFLRAKDFDLLRFQEYMNYSERQPEAQAISFDLCQYLNRFLDDEFMAVLYMFANSCEDEGDDTREGLAYENIFHCQRALLHRQHLQAPPAQAAAEAAPTADTDAETLTASAATRCSDCVYTEEMMQTVLRIMRIYSASPRCAYYTRVLYRFHQPLVADFLHTPHAESAPGEEDGDIYKSIHVCNLYAEQLFNEGDFAAAVAIYAQLHTLFAQLAKPDQAHEYLYKCAVCKHRLGELEDAATLYVAFIHVFVPELTATSVADVDVHALPVCVVRAGALSALAELEAASCDSLDGAERSGASTNAPTPSALAQLPVGHGCHSDDELRSLLGAMHNTVSIYRQLGRYTSAIFVQYLLYDLQREHLHRFGRLVGAGKTDTKDSASAQDGAQRAIPMGPCAQLAGYIYALAQVTPFQSAFRPADQPCRQLYMKAAGDCQEVYEPVRMAVPPDTGSHKAALADAHVTSIHVEGGGYKETHCYGSASSLASDELREGEGSARDDSTKRNSLVDLAERYFNLYLICVYSPTGAPGDAACELCTPTGHPQSPQQQHGDKLATMDKIAHQFLAYKYLHAAARWLEKCRALQSSHLHPLDDRVAATLQTLLGLYKTMFSTDKVEHTARALVAHLVTKFGRHDLHALAAQMHLGHHLLQQNSLLSAQDAYAKCRDDNVLYASVIHRHCLADVHAVPRPALQELRNELATLDVAVQAHMIRHGVPGVSRGDSHGEGMKTVAGCHPDEDPSERQPPSPGAYAYNSLQAYLHVLIEALHHFGRVAQRTHAYPAAQEAFLEAIFTYENYYKLVDVDPVQAANAVEFMLMVKHSLASIYFKLQQYADAEQYFRDIYVHKLAQHGEESLLICSAANEIASIYTIHQRYEEAHALYERVLRTRTAQLGDKHADTLLSLLNLAFICQKLGQLDESKEKYEDCLQKAIETLGKDNPFVEKIKTKYASLESEKRLSMGKGARRPSTSSETNRRPSTSGDTGSEKHADDSADIIAPVPTSAHCCVIS